MNPKMVQGHQLLGLLYLEEGNYEQAAKALEKHMPLIRTIPQHFVI